MTSRRALPVAWIALWLVAAAIVALSGWDASHRLARSLGGPQWPHLFGFDTYGRDVFLTVLRGSAWSVAFAALATVVASTIALGAGAGIAVAPAPLRFVLLRSLDALLAFPSLLFALGFAVVRGPGWDTIVFALLIGLAPALTRLAQARASELLAEDFVLAARSLGAGRARIVVHHLVPSIGDLIRLKAPQLFAQALLAEATLSFLGLGAPVGSETWGALLAQGKDYLIEAPHIALGAGIPLVLTVLALQSLSRNDEAGYIR